MIKAIILCAGVGSRLRPYTDSCPKPMLEISGKPLLEHTIDLLKSYGITEVAINLYHYSDAITGYFEDGSDFGVKIRYSLEEKPMGTAGALANLRDFFDDTFIVFYGDVLSNLDLKEIIRFHRKNNNLITIALYRVDNPTECGIVEFNGNNRITKFIEKPRTDEVFTNLANAGIYVIEPEILKYIPNEVPYDFGSNLFPLLLSKGIPIHGFEINGYLIDIGTKDKYEKAKDDFIKGRVHPPKFL